MLRQAFPRCFRLWPRGGPCRYMSKKGGGGIVMRFRPRARQMSPWNDFFDEVPRTPFRAFDEAFKNMADTVDRMMPRGWPGYMARPCWRWGLAEDAGTEVKYDNKLFQVKLDVGQFEPEDLTVKVTGNRLSVTGRHESKPDEHGFVSREFTREFIIPEDVDLETVSSKISPEGVLLIEADVKGEPEPEGKTIKIERETTEKKD